MFPKKSEDTAAVPSEKPTQQTKDSAILYIARVADQQVERQYSRWHMKRAMICGCVVVITTLILVAGLLGALAIVFRAHKTEIDEPSVPQERVHSDNNSPLEVPSPQPPIKIDDGGLLPPLGPVTPDLVAVGDVEEEIFVVSPKPGGIASPSPDTIRTPEPDGTASPTLDDNVAVDPAGEPSELEETFDPGTSFSSSSSSSSDSIPYHERSYVRRTYISSSFPYGGYYMRGGVGDPPPSLMSSGEESQLDQGPDANSWPDTDAPAGSSSGDGDLEASGDKTGDPIQGNFP